MEWEKLPEGKLTDLRSRLVHDIGGGGIPEGVTLVLCIGETRRALWMEVHRLGAETEYYSLAPQQIIGSFVEQVFGKEDGDDE